MKLSLQLGISSLERLRSSSLLRASTYFSQSQPILSHTGSSTFQPWRTTSHHPSFWRGTTFLGPCSKRHYSCTPCKSSPSAPATSTTPISTPSASASASSVDISSAKNDKIPCMYFDHLGRLDPHGRHLTKAQIAEQFELRHRDLREIDLKSEGAARILVRPSTILLQFFHLAMVIQADEALLINNVSGADSGRVADDQTHEGEEGEEEEDDDSEKRIQEAKLQREAIYRDFERRMSSPVLESGALPELPYELRAVEAALVAVLSNIHSAFVAARAKAELAAQSLRLDASGAGSIALDAVFERTRTLSQIEQKARRVRDTIRDVLDTDEDLAGMYLTDALAGRRHATTDHQEAEYMLEAYHKAADALVESASSVIDTLRKKENTFRSSLAVQRNQIMFLEARVAIHTLGLAAGTMVAGLFGMNLVNYLEDATYGFVAIGGVCAVLSAVFSALGMRSLWAIQSLKGIRAVQGHGRGRARRKGR